MIGQADELLATLLRTHGFCVGYADDWLHCMRGKLFRLMVALAVGPFIVGGSVLNLRLAGRGPDLTEEWGILAMNAVWVASPFLVLYLAGVTATRAWVAGIVITLTLWFGINLAAHSSTGNADIGFAFLLLASPLIVAAAAFGALKVMA